MGKHVKEIWDDDFDSPEHRKLYEKSVVPIAQRLMDCTPEGVLHMLGNVAEWTDSADFNFVDDQFKPKYFDHIIKGTSWGSNPKEDLTLSSHVTRAVDKGLMIIGFRCAKSVQP